jgi:hypothetical protein
LESSSQRQEEMILSDRQRTAENLAHEIGCMGAWVVTPLPLDSCARFRFQVLDKDCEKVLEKLAGWDWLPSPCGTLPRITHKGMEAASLYEIDLPLEREPVVDDRIHGEIAKRDPKMEAEFLAMLKACGIKK